MPKRQCQLGVDLTLLKHSWTAHLRIARVIVRYFPQPPFPQSVSVKDLGREGVRA
jgi:hypothetical protein